MNHWIIFKIAARNVLLHRLRSLISGSILIFGAFLGLLGHSVVDGMSGGMRKSITQSITGDIQVYSKDAKEKLSVFGNMDGSPSDVGHVNSFEKVQAELTQIPEVRAVVPMGTSFAQFSAGNVLDVDLENLRSLMKAPPTNSALQTKWQNQVQAKKEKIRFIIGEIFQSLNGRFDEIGMLSPAENAEAKRNLDRVRHDDFWTDFDTQYEQKIEFLANKLAPLIFDDNMLFFNYVGTDPQKFQKLFPQFEIVKGEMIPPGERGFLFHDYLYEHMVKHRIARRLDAIKEKLEGGDATIAGSKELQDWVKANVEQSAEIYLQLGPTETAELDGKLKMLKDLSGEDFRSRLKSYLQMSDDNFTSRYQIFYGDIAPHLTLYKVKIGDIMPLNAFTKTGTSTATNLKVYGTFRFKSFEKSPLAGSFSLMDLVSLRELYGFMTEERRAQNRELEAEMAVQDIDQNSIDSLFADGPSPSQKPPRQNLTNLKALKGNEPVFVKDRLSSRYQQSELDQGVFLHAAVFVQDPKQIDGIVEKINHLSEEKNLGLQAVTWQDAAGFIGQMTSMMKMLLNVFIFISLLLAGLMIMNSLLMSAMDRQQEIGTMRAIGADRRFIYLLFFHETSILALVFGGIGVLLASLIVLWIGLVGIPASGDVATFFFSGPRLYLHLDAGLVGLILFGLVVMAIFATQYPAWRAMRISPLQAMQKRE